MIVAKKEKTRQVLGRAFRVSKKELRVDCRPVLLWQYGRLLSAFKVPPQNLCRPFRMMVDRSWAVIEYHSFAVRCGRLFVISFTFTHVAGFVGVISSTSSDQTVWKEQCQLKIIS